MLTVAVTLSLSGGLPTRPARIPTVIGTLVRGSEIPYRSIFLKSPCSQRLPRWLVDVGPREHTHQQPRWELRWCSCVVVKHSLHRWCPSDLQVRPRFSVCEFPERVLTSPLSRTSGHLWTAKWWTQNETPGSTFPVPNTTSRSRLTHLIAGSSGVWTDNGAC